MATNISQVLVNPEESHLGSHGTPGEGDPELEVDSSKLVLHASPMIKVYWITPLMSIVCEWISSSDAKPEGSVSIFEELIKYISSNVLIIGSRGVGKSTLAKYFATGHESVLKFFDRIFLFDLSNPACCEAESFDQLIKASSSIKPPLTNIDDVEGLKGDKVLFVIDHGENVHGLTSNSFLKSILDKQMFPRATVFLTSMLCGVDTVHAKVKVDHCYELTGFSKKGVMHYFESNIPKRSLDTVINFLKQNELLTLCKNPLFCSSVLRILRDQKYKRPKTLTHFMYQIISQFVSHLLPDASEVVLSSGTLVQLECLPEVFQTIFNATCHFAAEYLISGHLCTDLVESRQFSSSFELRLSTTSLIEMCRFGLVEQVYVDQTSTSKVAYRFTHSSIMEFLAGMYLHKVPPLEQISFLAKHTRHIFRSKFFNWLKFYYGLSGEDFMQPVNFNPGKLIMTTVTELLVYALELSFETQDRYKFISCLHDTLEPSLVRKLAVKHPEVLTFSLKEDVGSWESVVSALVKYSECRAWHIEMFHENERVKLLQKVLSPKVKISCEYNQRLQEDTLVFSPQLDRAGEKQKRKQKEGIRLSDQKYEERRDKLNSFRCRVVRDILQRVLPLYSKVNLKGDSSNLSYVSFLGCSCLKESFQDNVQLYPFQPVHFLNVPPKTSGTSTSASNLSATERHNLKFHEGRAMEVVILLKPFLRRVQCTVPDTNEVLSIIISEERSDEPSDEVFSIKMDEHVVRCVEEVPHSEHPSPKIVAPCLPVVQRIGRKTQPALPSFTLAPATIASIAQIDPLGSETVAISHPLQEPKKLEQAPKVNIFVPQVSKLKYSRSDLVLEGMNEDFLLPLGTSTHPKLCPWNRRLSAELSRHFIPSTALTGGVTSAQSTAQLPLMAEQAVGEVHTSKRQVRPMLGTVLFTTIPDKIPSDHFLDLPKDQHLIRHGGNGYIYSGTVSGVVMAIKKTSYRSKEYAIITKLKHKNILPLLAFVWGPETARDSRRFTVFHYLPRLSGDLARMVTDKEELTMCEFRKSHRHNPRALGLAVGNLKYVLSQVLEGLKYMHSLHIGHRDVKASNVLLKFFCNCFSPLQCACDVKYQVVICDFDAAIEFMKEDAIPPIFLTSSRSNSAPSWQIVPVGTNGFRAPECSMSIIANSLGAFSPSVTTKCDIYSFGILSLRLFLSTHSPHSQREMAIMLLHYHQEKGMIEGNISKDRHNFLSISQYDVDNLLKLPMLELGMSWLDGACDFVRLCVKVDPDRRPTSSDLLTHFFITGIHPG